MDVKEESILGDAVYTHWYYLSKLKAIQGLLADIVFKRILDVGAGSGIFSKLLLIDAGSAARCVDTAYVDDERRELYQGKEIVFVKTINSVDEDVVLMIDVIEHVENDREFLKYYVDRMPVGGHVLISVPAFNLLWSGHDVFLEHKRRYSLGELESLVKNAGLHVVKGRYFFGLLFPIVAAIRIFSRWRGSTNKNQAKSDLTKASNIVNSLLIMIHQVEAKTLFLINRGAGLSAFCLAKKVS